MLELIAVSQSIKQTKKLYHHMFIYELIMFKLINTYYYSSIMINKPHLIMIGCLTGFQKMANSFGEFFN